MDIEFIGRLDLFDMFLAIVGAGSIYVAVDGLSRLGKVSGEYSRKAIHIAVGVFAASFPIFMNRTEIFVFHGMFFVGIVSLSLLADLFRTQPWAMKFKPGQWVAEVLDRYEDVSRWTIGQFLYPLSLMLVVLFYDDLLIYSFAVLVLALSDGFAAVIGKTFGKRIYFVPGGSKSIIGSFTFFVITFTLLCMFLIIQTEAGPIALIPALIYAMVLTFVEGAFAGGFDNLAVPLTAAVLLNTI